MAPTSITPSNIVNNGMGNYTISTTVAPASMPSLSVAMMSAIEAANAVNAASRVIFTSAVGYGSYRLMIGGAVFEITIRNGGMGEVLLNIIDTAKGNTSHRTLPAHEVYERSPQQLLEQYLPQMLNELAVFLKLEYVGP